MQALGISKATTSIFLNQLPHLVSDGANDVQWQRRWELELPHNDADVDKGWPYKMEQEVLRHRGVCHKRKNWDELYQPEKRQKTVNFIGKFSYSAIINRSGGGKRSHGGHGRKVSGLQKYTKAGQERDFRELLVSYSKEMQEAERLGWLGKNNAMVKTQAQSVKAGEFQPCQK
ncbi:hypothetical protein C1H46_026640 [Malus baccata]|uniref:Uncharacterized protein n=1 Tax=Malus baccata TaxID=106549 RepID=A0A540LN08_MALBA|nr:hypothetical protein C1H46_026640 [Malus baccata]